jgi:hypothetical protein
MTKIGVGLVVCEMVVIKWLVEMRSVVLEEHRGDRSNGCPLKENDPPIRNEWWSVKGAKGKLIVGYV